MKLVLRALETDNGELKEEIRRMSGGRHPPLMRALFDSIPR